MTPQIRILLGTDHLYQLLAGELIKFPLEPDNPIEIEIALKDIGFDRMYGILNEITRFSTNTSKGGSTKPIPDTESAEPTPITLPFKPLDS